MSHQSSSQGYSEGHHTPHIWHRTWPWIVVAGMAIAACVLGYLGFRRHALDAGTGDTTLNLIYKTLQLFVLESGYIVGSTPWQLEIARVLAPLAPAWAVLQALRALFQKQREAFSLRRRKDHVVVCGLGRKGLQLVADFRRKGNDVVVIEKDESNPHLGTCQYLGARILIGSCTDKSLLSRARAERARYVFAITGDDGTNVEAAILVHQLVCGRNSKIIGTVRCFVHVVALNLCRLLKRHDLLSAPDDNFKVTIFNSFQNSARALLDTYPLERKGFGKDDPRTVHLVVFGFGKMGESVVLQAAKLGHYANGMTLRITVVDPRAPERQASFANRYPQMGKISDVELEFIAASEESRDLQTMLKNWAADPNTITSIAVCLDGDSSSLTCALNIITTLQPEAIPTYVRMSKDTGLATLFEDRPGPGDWADQVHAFGMTSFCSSLSMVLNPDRDILAKAFHEKYVEEGLKAGKSKDDSNMQPWEILEVDYNDSNRQMADHVPVKLRAIGCFKDTTSAAAQVKEFKGDEIEIMARMEHARWWAERLMAGWEFGADNAGQKTNVCLLGWEDLRDEDRDKDRQAVGCIPQVLGRIREKVFRDSGAGLE